MRMTPSTKHIYSLLLNVPVGLYTSDLTFEWRYCLIIRICQPWLNKSLIEDIAFQHLARINKLKGYYHFSRTWKMLLGADKLKGIMNDFRKDILRNVATEIYNNEGNYFQSIKMLDCLDLTLNLKSELKSVYAFLKDGIIGQAENSICGFCRSKGMYIYEEVLVCNKCGFSKIL